MSIGKYVTNPGVLAAAVGAISTARQTGDMRQDWRRLLVWAAWITGLALAISSVAKQEEDAEFETQRQAVKQADKEAAKLAKKQRKRG